MNRWLLRNRLSFNLPEDTLPHAGPSATKYEIKQDSYDVMRTPAADAPLMVLQLPGDLGQQDAVNAGLL